MEAAVYCLCLCLYSAQSCKHRNRKFLTGRFLGLLLHLPPLRFHCAGGCWDWTQDSNNSARYHHKFYPVFSTVLFTLTWSRPTFCWWRADSNSSTSGLPAASSQTRPALSRFFCLALLNANLFFPILLRLRFWATLALSLVIICFSPSLSSTVPFSFSTLYCYVRYDLPFNNICITVSDPVVC